MIRPRYAIGYCFYDYGWYEKLIEKTSKDEYCYTQHSSFDFVDKTIYDNITYNSIDDCIKEINSNINKYIQYVLPSNIDYVSGKRNGSLYAVQLNKKQDGWIDMIRLFDCKSHKLIKV